MTQQFNSSIIGSAYSLCVPVEAVASFVKNWEDGQYITTRDSNLDRVVEEMAIEVSKTNPTLAQRWRLLKVLQSRKSVES